MADTETARDTLYRSLSVMFNVNDPTERQWIEEIYGLAAPMITAGDNVENIPDQILMGANPPAAFAARFKGVIDLKKKRDAGQNVYVPSISQYVTGEQEYADLASRMGMKNIGTRQNYAKLVGEAEVSLREVTDRIADATARVRNLDATVKEQLKTEFPSLTDGAMAEAILTPNGISELEKKIGRSEINVEAQQAGITSALGAEALRAGGVTREQARTGFQTTREFMKTAGQGLQETAKRYGDNLSTQDLQTELEKETMLGQTSVRRKRLASQARSEFGGQSGIATGSLAKKRSSQL